MLAQHTAHHALDAGLQILARHGRDVDQQLRTVPMTADQRNAIDTIKAYI